MRRSGDNSGGRFHCKYRHSTKRTKEKQIPGLDEGVAETCSGRVVNDIPCSTAEPDIALKPRTWPHTATSR